MKVVGRKNEIKIMTECLSDEKSHMLAMIGRRRVGKTFLIREVFKKSICFEMTGLKDADLSEQLLNFNYQLNHYFNKDNKYEIESSWLAAFNQLTTVLKKSRSKKKKVVFFDEVPWIATKRSGFAEALGHWWNNWASQQNIVLVLCGSAAAWMLKNIVNAKGGLHNRITQLITLQSFTLAETQRFLLNKNIALSDFQLVQLYMAVGGIPHYLEHVKKGKSAAQNIQDMCFSKNGALRAEFDNLYPALFENASSHIKIVNCLADKPNGLDRQDILKLTEISDGGWFTDILNELESSGFISSFEPLENRKKDMIFRLTDEFSLFYLNFIKTQKQFAKDYWLRESQSQKYKIWCGYAFENVCMKHAERIEEALEITGIQTSVNSFLHRKDQHYNKGFQIDMLIDRKDDVINICEMKFYSDTYTITKDYAEKLRTKKVGLETVTDTNKLVQIVFVSSYGITDNKYYSDYVTHDFKLDIFFDYDE